MAAAEAASVVHTMSPAHVAELSSAMSTGQALFRRQLESLQERLRASNHSANAVSSYAETKENRHNVATRATGSSSAPPLEAIKAQFEQRRRQAAQDMKQLLANVDPSLAIF